VTGVQTCALPIFDLYRRLKDDPNLECVPRTVIFAGKAAPAYHLAKLIIKLINAVGVVINRDRSLRDCLRVVFLPNFNVGNGQRIYPAADLSEQISTAGKEASGTGNMKFMMNGALTIGTLDGANIEIREEAGAGNFFLFGHTTEEVEALKRGGYRPMEHYLADPALKATLDLIAGGLFSPNERDLFRPLVDNLLYSDQYLLLADFADYVDAQNRVSATYADPARWTRMSILNTARSGKFSSDRSIAEYARDIWRVPPVRIRAGER
jgi:starch phosphorylase